MLLFTAFEICLHKTDYKKASSFSCLLSYVFLREEIQGHFGNISELVLGLRGLLPKGMNVSQDEVCFGGFGVLVNLPVDYELDLSKEQLNGFHCLKKQRTFYVYF